MKLSSAKAIRSKQSSAYRACRLTPPTITALQQLKSFPRSGGVSQAMLDQIAEAKMNQGWSRSSNPICSSCYVQKSLNGACNC